MPVSDQTQLQAAGAPEDGRAAPRFQLLLRPARVTAARGQYVAVLRDISQTGAKVRFFHDIPDGEQYILEVREGFDVPMRAVWKDGLTAGFHFDAPIDVEKALRSDPDHPRRQVRIELNRPATLIASGVEAPVVLHDLSQQGACIGYDRALARSQLIRLRIDKVGERHAKVCWSRDDRHGLVLEETFELREFAAVIEAINAAG